jgi:ABC-type glycerol-3-phosphate transport system substrate-binding protein
MSRRVLVALLVLALGSGLALASCGGDEAADTETTETTTTTTTTPTTTTTTTTTTEPPPGPTVVRVRVVGGAPKGGIVRETVQQGDRVVIVVTSDVADHVHLHGYDIMRDVAAGGTARIRFRATVPGRFEVELEDRGVQIADLTVEP